MSLAWEMALENKRCYPAGGPCERGSKRPSRPRRRGPPVAGRETRGCARGGEAVPPAAGNWTLHVGATNRPPPSAQGERHELTTGITAAPRGNSTRQHRRRTSTPRGTCGCWLTLELADLRGEIAAAIAAEREAREGGRRLR